MKYARRAAMWSVLFASVASAAGTPRPEDADPVSRTPIPATIDFNRDVRPILSNACFACHGPDEKTREAGLRLDTPDGISQVLKSGAVAVVPGDTAKSAIIARITTTEPKDVMPPAKTGKTLTLRQVEILKRWIEQGGRYDKHWSFNPPRPDQPPPAADLAWSHPIDAFLLQGIREAGLTPSEEADKRTLIRRVTLDLTGLPPTLEEVSSFLADTSPDAYEKVVDRLLASPHYGEKMATDWLDAARFADTNGYHIDNERYMWKWREWVIDAFNRNVPFDRFTIEQLAGDMLPACDDPAMTERQVLASGFNRNHMINFEGGAIPEEYMHNYLVDRVNTTSTVWLGLTMSCAQCHDHKYDPITQEDYYRFYAIFNNVPEKGLDGNSGNSEPFMKFPNSEEKSRLAALLERIKNFDDSLTGPMPETDALQADWEKKVAAFDSTGWLSIAPLTSVGTGGSTFAVQPDQSVTVSGKAPERETYELLCLAPATPGASVSALRLEAMLDDALPEKGPGRAFNGNVVLSEVEVEAVPLATPDKPVKVPLVNAFADYSQDKFDIAYAIDGKPETGWATGSHLVRSAREAVFTFDRPVSTTEPTLIKVRLRFDSQYAQHALGRFRLALLTDESRHPSLARASLSPWHVAGPFEVPANIKEALAADLPIKPVAGQKIDLAATYADGAIKWEQRDDLVDGQVHMLPSTDYRSTFFRRTISTTVQRRMVLSLGSDDALRVWLDGVKVHEAGLQGRAPAPDQDSLTLDLSPGDHELVMEVVNFTGGYAMFFRVAADDGMPAPLNIAKILRTPTETRDDAARAAVRDYYRASQSVQWRELKQQRDAVAAEHKALDDMLPTAMVMKELETPRKTHLHIRGEYDQLGHEVSPGVPRSLPQLPADQPANRLTLARWLVDGNNPLTARVYVNRLWQSIFGTGLVKTAEDFGLQGQWPSNPQLLDWLASDFVAGGWDIKRMLRQIVTTRAYRQLARATDRSLAVDPEDRLLSFFPRVRLNAEGIRDSALFISGLANLTIGGRSVRPYQPPGLWEEMSLDPTGATFSAQVYKQDTGELLYRRTMYTFRKRTVPHPVLAIFDAPNRELCVVRRATTNTPLQALVVLNETGFVEAARHFAQRVLAVPGDDAARAAYAFELATAQRPTPEQSAILLELLADQRRSFEDTAQAEKLLAVGESPRDTSLDPHEHAAWTMVCNAILNLDQTLVKD
ncbi:MAG: hypothetical protein GIKADHBN_01289 [Phycisphaerales bacterium]|nr:hypothetical protein [Phycisphaerales bacterium]